LAFFGLAGALFHRKRRTLPSFVVQCSVPLMLPEARALVATVRARSALVFLAGFFFDLALAIGLVLRVKLYYDARANSVHCAGSKSTVTASPTANTCVGCVCARRRRVPTPTVYSTVLPR